MTAALASMAPTMAVASSTQCSDVTSVLSVPYTWSGGDCNVHAGGGLVTNAGGNYVVMGLYGTGSNMGTLTNAGTMSATNAYSAEAGGLIMAPGTGAARVINASTGRMIGSITGYTATDSNTNAFAAGVRNQGTISVLDNFGYIAGAVSQTGDNTLTDPNSSYSMTLYAAGVANSGVIGTINNASSGIITGSTDSRTGLNLGTQGVAIYNNGQIVAIMNNGRILGQYFGIVNDNATIGLINNSGTISASQTGATGILNGNGTIGTLVNSGVINTPYAIMNNGDNATIGVINNSGTIGSSTAGGIAIVNSSGTVSGGIGTIINSGLIGGSNQAILNQSGTITAINNSGTIRGGIVNGYATSGYIGYATIGSLTNSGLISADNAISNVNGSTIGVINNSGTIAGTITSASTLNFVGGSGSTFGTLTGYTTGNTPTLGLIVGSGSIANINFVSGNILLNDNVTLYTDSTNPGNDRTLSNIAATLKVNQSVSITGNYSQGAGATLQIGVADNASATGSLANDTGYGRLVVSGNADVASGSSIVLKKNGSYGFAANQRYVVITAGGTGTYHEGSLNYAISGLTGATLTGANTNNSLVVTIVSLPSASSQPSSSSGLSTAPNAVAALGGLGRYGGISSGLLNLYNASLAIGSTALANKTGEQLAPTQSQNAASAASAATFGGLNVVSDHVNGLRVAQAGGASGVATGESTGTWAGWTQVFGGDAHQGVIDSISGYKASYSGLVLGADRSFGDAWRAGAAFTHSQTSVSGADNLAGSGSHVDAYGLIAYASYTAQPWYLNLSASAVRNSYDSSRTISLTGDVARGSYNGWQYVAKVEAGYPLALAKNLTLTPLASLSLSRLKLDGYTETGSGAALAVQGSGVNAVRSGLGARIEQSTQTSLGELTPFAQLVWSHQYNDSRMSTTASFVADSTGVTSFTTQGAAPTKNVAELSLGANLLKSNDLTLSARYDLQAARKYDAQTFSVRLQKRF